MIRRILIHNSPAFNDIELRVQGGFNVFSGASGSGKSVFMESLLAIFGIKESNADLIEANLSLDSVAFDWLENGIPQDEESNEMVLSILKKEKTRYFLNHASSSKKKLYEIVSGFAKHISIKGSDELKGKNILHILDTFIVKDKPEHKQILNTYAQDFFSLKTARTQLLELEEQEKNLAHLKEFTAFEIQKIESIAPKEGEYEELLELKKVLSKQEKVREQIAKVYQVLEHSREFETFLQLIDEKCPSLFEGLNDFEALVEKQEGLLDNLQDIDPESILDRISALAELNRRFGGTQEALAYLAEQKQKLLEYENLSFDKQNLQNQVSDLLQKCEHNAQFLQASREEYAPKFNAYLQDFCTQLRLNPSSVSIHQVPLNETGSSECEIRLGQSGVEVLSSGEYNRLRLAIMCIDASLEERSGILVLDEIDANLSGEESEGVAKILKTLSKSYQVFAISHQTHMPSLADHHYLVQKNGEKSTLVELDFEGRVKEIARMISGSEITPEALEFAKKQLSQYMHKIG